jgi:hypothetical protein
LIIWLVDWQVRKVSKRDGKVPGSRNRMTLKGKQVSDASLRLLWLFAFFEISVKQGYEKDR